MSGFIAWLEKLNEVDNKAKAVLRRSLSFNPLHNVSEGEEDNASSIFLLQKVGILVSVSPKCSLPKVKVCNKIF